MVWKVSKCGQWAYLFALNVVNEKILLDIAALGGVSQSVTWAYITIHLAVDFTHQIQKVIKRGVFGKKCQL